MFRIVRNRLHWAARRLNIVAHLTAENNALRQQLIVLKRKRNRSKRKDRDRLFWAILPRAWSGWRNVTVIIQPDSVLRLHKKAFKLYWLCKSRGAKRGWTPLDPGVKALIVSLSLAKAICPEYFGRISRITMGAEAI